MKAFMPAGNKFTAHGYTWVAGPETSKHWATAMAEKRQVWRSKKTWLVIVCCYDIRKEKLSWKVGRFDTASTRTGAAAMAASMTREQLDTFVDRLALYGDEPEKRYARMILKKKKQNLPDESKTEEVKW